jgi:hypothetical protein
MYEACSDGHLHGPFRIESLEICLFKWKNICDRPFRRAEIKLNFMQISVAGGSGLCYCSVFATVEHPRARRVIEVFLGFIEFSSGLNSTKAFN